MPRASKPCSEPGCPEIAVERGKCHTHLKAVWKLHNKRTNDRYSNAEYQRNKKLARKRDGNRCRWQGCEATSNLSVHHIVALRDGGTHALGNLVTLCRPHHEEAERGGVPPKRF